MVKRTGITRTTENDTGIESFNPRPMRVSDLKCKLISVQQNKSYATWYLSRIAGVWLTRDKSSESEYGTCCFCSNSIKVTKPQGHDGKPTWGFTTLFDHLRTRNCESSGKSAHDRCRAFKSSKESINFKLLLSKSDVERTAFYVIECPLRCTAKFVVIHDEHNCRPRLLKSFRDHIHNDCKHAKLMLKCLLGKASLNKDKVFEPILQVPTQFIHTTRVSSNQDCLSIKRKKSLIRNRESLIKSFTYISWAKFKPGGEDFQKRERGEETTRTPYENKWVRTLKLHFDYKKHESIPIAFGQYAGLGEAFLILILKLKPSVNLENDEREWVPFYQFETDVMWRVFADLTRILDAIIAQRGE